MFLLKILNPFIWLVNIFMYFCHLEGYRDVPRVEYVPYNFDKDIKYF